MNSSLELPAYCCMSLRHASDFVHLRIHTYELYVRTQWYTHLLACFIRLLLMYYTYMYIPYILTIQKYAVHNFALYKTALPLESNANDANDLNTCLLPLQGQAL